jgi:hypothetical protein
MEIAQRNEECLGQHEAALRTIADRYDTIFALSVRLAALEEERKRTKSCINKANKATAQGDDISHDANGALEYENKLLRGAEHQDATSERDYRHGENQKLRPADKGIREQCELILTNLKGACANVNIVPPLAFITPRQDSILPIWTLRATGHCFGDLVAHSRSSNIQKMHLEVAFAASAATVLAFESNFPDFLSRASPMLDQYRQQTQR